MSLLLNVALSYSAYMLSRTAVYGATLKLMATALGSMVGY
jgi:hypothetical protein